MVPEEQLRIIKRLVLKYQSNRSAQLFEQILERVDCILIGIVRKLSKLHFFVEPNIQDMYQTAIIGMAKAIDSFKEVDSPNKILLRLFVYIRKEMFQQYGRKRLPLAEVYRNRPERSLAPSVDRNLIQEDRKHFLTSLITKGIVSESEMELLVLRYVDGKSISRIIVENGDSWGKTRGIVTNRINLILTRIREEIGSEEFNI